MKQKVSDLNCLTAITMYEGLAIRDENTDTFTVLAHPAHAMTVETYSSRIPTIDARLTDAQTTCIGSRIWLAISA
jgi:hypothetical protein